MNWTEEEYAEHLIKRKQGKKPGPAHRRHYREAADTPAVSADTSLTLEVCPDVKLAAKRVQRERAEQIAYFDQVRARLIVDPVTRIVTPKPGYEGAECIFALANENAAGKGVGILLWKMGVRAGLPDIGVFVPKMIEYPPGFARNCPGLFIEMKCSDGVSSDVRPTQKAVHDCFNKHGYKVVVAYGWRRAWTVTCEYMGWKP